MPRASAPTKTASKRYASEDAYATFRVMAHNPTFTGETEGIGFSNGMATVHGLPKTVTCDLEFEDCMQRSDATGDVCRVHERVFRLNNLLNYPYVERVESQSGPRSVIKNAYRVLSESEYEEESSRQEGALYA